MPLVPSAHAVSSGARSLAQVVAAGLFVLTTTLVACDAPPRPATPTATFAPIVLATEAPTWTPLTQPSATAARTLVVQATISPTPVMSPVAASPIVYVTNTGGQGLAMRQAPGGASMGIIPEGTALTATGEEQISDGRKWIEVKDAAGNVGWVAFDFVTASPQAQASPQTQGTATRTPLALPPTVTIGLIPTATHAVPQPTVTRTPLPSPAPTATRVTPATIGPLSPALPVAPAATSASIDRSPVPRR